MKRFLGAGIALGALALIGGTWFFVTQMQPAEVADVQTPQIFAFEKEDLRGITLTRPEGTLQFQLGKDGDWEWVGRDWRPSSSMVRRVGHQTHDLVARAKVADPGTLEEYGFGDDAISIKLDLEGGRSLTFQAGVPNPTSVSWYVRPVPGDTVYVVKKSAVDYWRMDVEDFREDRFAALDADEAVVIDATVDGRRIAFKRVDERRWQQSEPMSQRADLQRIRTMLGRTGSLRSSTFVEDKPADLAKYGLEPYKHSVKIGVESGESVTLHVGDVVPDSEPQERYIYRVEDDAVYRGRDGFLSAFLLDDADYRDTRLLYLDAGTVTEYVVSTPDYEPIPIRRTPDGWRWPDDAPINGMTPKRLASDITDPRARQFIDDATDLAKYGLDPAANTVSVKFDGSEPVLLLLGDTFDDDSSDPPEPSQYLMIAGDPVVYVVQSKIASRIKDLLNEYGKKLEGDEEKGLLNPTEEAVEPVPAAPQ
ncbi:MAG: DUF4340 domain-containing protein [Myxococcota bacterium]